MSDLVCDGQNGYFLATALGADVDGLTRHARHTDLRRPIAMISVSNPSCVYWTRRGNRPSTGVLALRIRMLHPLSNVQQVGFEDGPNSFGDLWVEYMGFGAPIDYVGKPVLRDHIQSKWNVPPGEYGCRDVTDAKFKNASALSFLLRAQNAQVTYAPDGVGSRFRLAYHPPHQVR